MRYRPLDTIARSLRLVLFACAGLYLMDASRVVGSLAEYAVYEEKLSRGGSQVLLPSGRPDPLQSWELAAVIIAVVLLVLFFVRAYRNRQCLDLTGVLWRDHGRHWRIATAWWGALVAIAAASVAFGNRLGAGPTTIDQAQILTPLEAAGEFLTASAAVFTSLLVTAIALRQSRRAAELVGSPSAHAAKAD